MGPALNIASSENAYVLSDRGTWLNFKNRGDLAILVEGDNKLFNQYGVIAVNPAKHPHVKAADAQKFVDWVGVARRAGHHCQLGLYKIGGEQLFFPNAANRCVMPSAWSRGRCRLGGLVSGASWAQTAPAGVPVSVYAAGSLREAFTERSPPRTRPAPAPASP